MSDMINARPVEITIQRDSAADEAADTVLYSCCDRIASSEREGLTW